MKTLHFIRTEKGFYVTEKGRTCFQMRANAEYAGNKVQGALVWDFPLSTLSLDGDIDEPNTCDECFELLSLYEREGKVPAKLIIDDLSGAFFSLYATGEYTHGVSIESTDDARIAWATEAKEYILAIEAERSPKDCPEIFSHGDVVKIDQSKMRVTRLVAQWIKGSGDDREKIVVAQFPQEDSLRDVWVKEGSKWTVATVRGSHTIPTHIRVDGEADAWQTALRMFKRWCEMHEGNPVFSRVESDGEFFTLDDVADDSINSVVDFNKLLGEEN